MILHIGKNDGSHQNNSIRVLRQHGIDCMGMTFYYSDKQETDNLFVFKKWQFVFYYLLFFIQALRADLVHLWSEQLPFIVLYLKLIRKPYCVEWTGSDIRNPHQCLIDSVNAYVIGDCARYAKNVNKFRDVTNIFSSQVLIDHYPYDNKIHIAHRLDLDRFSFNPTSHTPLRVAHCTSHREAKGTDKILPIMLGVEGIDFMLIENVSRQDAIDAVSGADIVIGQMVWGEHGTQELESIAMGKPVLCYINHNKETPVLKCRLDEITKWIKYFIDNPDQIRAQAYLSYNELLKEQAEAVEKLIYLYESLDTKHFIKPAYN